MIEETDQMTIAAEVSQCQRKAEALANFLARAQVELPMPDLSPDDRRTGTAESASQNTLLNGIIRYHPDHHGTGQNEKVEIKEGTVLGSPNNNLGLARPTRP
ncbi:MAG: hypothetical protein WAS49_03305 [Candidatus Dechloromonas phosphoritropha]|nr:hypothetical protein [Candidatus Dechloromonas phosphoritropha]MBL0355321.1 hypothetical protein [Candidatus Dechloromonas phosphoritropha]MBP8788431.1 hypothetical protein [Azonexus sp.]MBP9228865.1 hypothetical protein [Azonexus sp.]